MHKKIANKLKEVIKLLEKENGKNLYLELKTDAGTKYYVCEADEEGCFWTYYKGESDTFHRIEHIRLIKIEDKDKREEILKSRLRSYVEQFNRGFYGKGYTDD